MYLVVAIVLLLVMTSIVSVLVFYVMFRRTPLGRWRYEVKARFESATRLRRQSQIDCESAAGNEESQARVLSSRALDSYLRSIPISELREYEGIGPATIDRLRDAGFRRVTELQGARIDVPGLGEKRIADINNALRAIIRSAQSRFQSGACEEAHALADQLRVLKQQRVRLEKSSQRKIHAIDRFMTEIQPVVEMANGISFWQYLREQFSSAATSDRQEILETPIPDVEDFLSRPDSLSAPAAHASVPASVDAPAPVVNPAKVPAMSAVPVPLQTQSHSQETKPRRSEKPHVHRPRTEVTHKVAQVAKSLDVAPPQTIDELEHFVRFALAIARADGPVSPRNRDLIFAFLRDRCGNDRAKINRSQMLVSHYETAAIDTESTLQFLGRRGTLEARRDYYSWAKSVIESCGSPTSGQIGMLGRVASAFGIEVPPEQARSPISPSAAGPAPAKVGLSAAPTRLEMLTSLEISTTTEVGPELIRRQFNLLCQRLASAAQLDEQFRALATTKLAAVRSAALALLAEFGEELEPSKPAPTELRHNPDLDDVFGAP
jgi:hypothetical protein